MNPHSKKKKFYKKINFIVSYSIFFSLFLIFFAGGAACSGSDGSDHKELAKKKEVFKEFQSGAVKTKYAQKLAYQIKKDGYDIHIDLGGESQVIKLRRSPSIKGEVQIPVKKVIALSTTQVAPIVLLGQEKTLKAFSTLKLISSPQVRKLIDQEVIEEVGTIEKLDVERVLRLKPDILLASYFPRRVKTSLAPLLDSGAQVIELSAYLESHPLGRAEWLYLYGMLYDELALAQKLFLEIEKKYLTLRQQILTSKKNIPKVLLGIPYKGVWYVPRLDSYMGTFVKDAGARMWNSHPGVGSVGVDFEEVLAQSRNADVWMIIDNEMRTKSELVKIDHRYAFFDAFERGEVYNNNGRMTLSANGYWESGVIEPHEILADIIQMCHGKKMLDRKMKYICKLE